MKKTSVLWIIPGLLASAWSAPEAKGAEVPIRPSAEMHRLDLQRSVEMALDRNFTIRVEKISPEIASQEVVFERSIFDPTLRARFEHSKQDSPQLSDPFNTQIPEAFTLEEDTLGISVRGLLPTGTEYEIGIDSENEHGTFNQFTDEYFTFVGIRITQPILRDFGLKVNRARIHIARSGYAISEWEFTNTVMDTITETVFAYNDLFLAHRNLEVAERSRDLARTLFEQSLKRVELGTMASLDVVVAEAELALRSERVLVAERIMLDQKNRLKNLIFDDIEDLLHREITIVAPPKPSRVAVDPSGDLSAALEKRPDYRQAVLRLDVRKRELLLERNRALPTLDVVGSFGLSGRENTFGGSLDRLAENENQAYSMGLVFSVPVPNRGGKSSRASARLTRDRTELELRRLEQNILLSLDNMANRIRTDWLRIEAAGRARALAQKSLRAEEKKLQAGRSTTFVVLRLQSDLAEAEIRELQAITDYNKALAEYDRQKGTTLERYSVVL